MNEEKEISVLSALQERVSLQNKVTLDDVIEALKFTIDEDKNITSEVTDAFETNANKIRKILGNKGSNETIHKHLAVIRDNVIKSRMEALDNAASEVPAAPKELVKSLWESAWRSAQVVTLSRIERLTVERDGLKLKADAQANDIESLSDQVDELESNVADLQNDIVNNKIMVEKIEADAEQNIENVRTELTNENILLEKSKGAIESDLINLNNEFESVKKDALHQKELSDRDAEIVKTTMQSTIDNLNDKVSELKAMRISDLKDMKEVDISSK